MIGLREYYELSSPSPIFTPGELVYHVHYEYRGVVVEVDEVCQASDKWYQSNQTQPERNQPWYNVLVDGSQQTTYVAQCNLKLDARGKPIRHPLIEHFFCEFQNGRYLRNNESWPNE